MHFPRLFHNLKFLLIKVVECVFDPVARDAISCA